jgi:hypothetical protein
MPSACSPLVAGLMAYVQKSGSPKATIRAFGLASSDVLNNDSSLKTLRPVLMEEREISADQFRGEMKRIFLKTVQDVSIESTLQSAEGQVSKPGSQ